MIGSCQPAPVLKWAGGKRQLLPHLRRFYPARFAAYIEPFVGSGAVFFDLWAAGKLHGPVRLSDENADLIGTYLRLADSADALVSALERLAGGHARDGCDHYYAVRDTQFNPARSAWQARGGCAHDYPVSLAAMLLYLNRTGYNGLFRLNRRGEFNVPAGRYAAPRIAIGDRLRCAAEALSAPNVQLRRCAFDEALQQAEQNDFVYLDPPYAPLSTTSNFRSYTARGFGDDDQERLKDAVVRAARRGASILLSNSVAPQVVRLYESPDVKRAELRVRRVPARRAINSRASSRGPIEELLVTNLPEHD